MSNEKFLTSVSLSDFFETLKRGSVHSVKEWAGNLDEIAEHLDKLLPDFEIKSWILAMEVGPGVLITSFDQHLEPLFDNNGAGHLAVKVNHSFKGMACRISFLSVGPALS